MVRPQLWNSAAFSLVPVYNHDDGVPVAFLSLTQPAAGQQRGPMDIVNAETLAVGHSGQVLLPVGIDGAAQNIRRPNTNLSWWRARSDKTGQDGPVFLAFSSVDMCLTDWHGWHACVHHRDRRPARLPAWHDRP